MRIASPQHAQKIFRRVLQAFASPGTILEMQPLLAMRPQGERVPVDGIYDGTLALAELLLDQDTTHEVIGESTHASQSVLTLLTGSPYATLETAHFVFILKQADLHRMVEAVQKANRGTLLEPHTSATLIFEIPSLNHGPCYRLKGPGILKERKQPIDLHPTLIELRRDVDFAYPLGQDWIVIDQESRCLALPRTTRIDPC
ncbi:MAG: PhnH protein [Candidatus Carbobacillus altaicus]|uniref:PhnH protein n=1 Tax=Candidatus Carbonibacillus altaicus TaxID=2163959 RepID=A0A2R6Y2A2_9BACL|nr:MAG: PhnH protein [Candidatus Carbobacillus altaicus]